MCKFTKRYNFSKIGNWSGFMLLPFMGWQNQSVNTKSIGYSISGAVCVCLTLVMFVC